MDLKRLLGGIHLHGLLVDVDVDLAVLRPALELPDPPQDVLVLHGVLVAAVAPVPRAREPVRV